MGPTSWASWSWSLVQTVYSRSTTCSWGGAQWEAVHHYGRPCGACAGTHYGVSSLNNYGTKQSFPSRSLLHKIVTEHLFWKLWARWVPNQLTPEQKAERMDSALTFLQQYYEEGDEFLDRIITGDETLIAHITPESKQQSMHSRGGQFMNDLVIFNYSLKRAHSSSFKCCELAVRERESSCANSLARGQWHGFKRSCDPLSNSCFSFF